MKKKLMLGIVAMASLMATTSFADVYKTLGVQRTATTANGTCQLMLETDENTGSYKWYSVPSGSDDQALAVALTAISLGSKVRVGLPVAGSSVLTQIGLDNQQ